MTEPESTNSFKTWPHATTDGEPEDALVAEDDGDVDPTFEQLAAVSAERDEYLDQLQRSRAEFANFRR
ncbi:MAG: hypothetical protein WBA46_18665, partial [Thermomicrobiales bacterium]